MYKTKIALVNLIATLLRDSLYYIINFHKNLKTQKEKSNKKL